MVPDGTRLAVPALARPLPPPLIVVLPVLPVRDTSAPYASQWTVHRPPRGPTLRAVVRPPPTRRPSLPPPPTRTPTTSPTLSPHSPPTRRTIPSTRRRKSPRQRMSSPSGPRPPQTLPNNPPRPSPHSPPPSLFLNVLSTQMRPDHHPMPPNPPHYTHDIPTPPAPRWSRPRRRTRIRPTTRIGCNGSCTRRTPTPCQTQRQERRGQGQCRRRAVQGGQHAVRPSARERYTSRCLELERGLKKSSLTILRKAVRHHPRQVFRAWTLVV